MSMMMRKIDAAVLFVQDLDKCMMFYRDQLGFPVTFSDDNSFAFRLEDQDFVLLKLSAAANMVGEEALSLHNEAGHRVLLCVGGEDVGAVYKAFTAKGDASVHPPITRPWRNRPSYSPGA